MEIQGHSTLQRMEFHAVCILFKLITSTGVELDLIYERYLL